MVKKCIMLAVGTTILVLTSCTQHRVGPAEKAGERIDEIVDNAEEGKPLLHKKGTLEKAGEGLDKALGADDD